jgi:NADPH:quinone reductase-like Zn-dependent oxidoreductase
MRQIVIRKPGGYSRLELIEAPDPMPGPTEVLVETERVGVNYADCVVRRGLYSSAKKYVGWPITPGFEFSGRVLAIGARVSTFAVGQSVFGVTRFGGYSTHVVVPEAQLYVRPQRWDANRAATFPTVHLTAWYALCELARPRPSKAVLVHSAAGGVGLAALAICKHLGLKSVGVVGGSHKVDAARAAGADHVIDRSRQQLWREVERLVPNGFDIVLESSGVATLRESYAHLRPTGRLVVFGMSTLLPRGFGGNRWLQMAFGYLRLPRFNPLLMIEQNKTVSAFNLSYLFEEQSLLQEAMRELLAWDEAGALPEPPIREYPLERACDAHRDLESGNTVGKLVLVA